jgi:hypothetical protein
VSGGASGGEANNSLVLDDARLEAANVVLLFASTSISGFEVRDCHESLHIEYLDSGDQGFPSSIDHYSSPLFLHKSM